MNKILPIVFLFLLSLPCFGQINLVPNSSFENYNSCPTSVGQVYRATSWNSYSNSSDYFNSCASFGTGVSVPQNTVGYQYANTGNAYSGFFSYLGSYREYIGCKLNMPLSIGQKYYACMHVNLAEWSNCGHNKLGFLLLTDTSGIDSAAVNSPLLQNYAQIVFDTIILDTAQWVFVKAQFVSDSVYQYLVIGNFYDSANIQTANIDTSTICGASYYFVDDIVLSTDSSLCEVLSVSTIERREEKLRVFPNPSSGIFGIIPPIKSSSDPITVSLFNHMGALEDSNDFLGWPSHINLKALPSGCYILEVNDQTNRYRTKLILIH